MADLIINTSKFTVHELREFIGERFRGQRDESKILIYVTSFGYRNGVPPDSDLVFDVRFLPNPNYIPRFKNLTGRHPSVARYIRSFPQTVEFVAADLGSAGLPAAALHPRRQELPDDRLRLHRRPAPLRDDGGADPQEPGGGGVQGEGEPPRYRQTEGVAAQKKCLTLEPVPPSILCLGRWGFCRLPKRSSRREEQIDCSLASGHRGGGGSG